MEVHVRTAAEKHFMDRAVWVPVENRRGLGLPLGGYLQWRLVMSTRDVWRPPGASRIIFGLSRADASKTSRGPGGGQWGWFLLMVVAAAAVAYFLIGRRTWWERRKRRA